MTSAETNRPASDNEKAVAPAAEREVPGYAMNVREPDTGDRPTWPLPTDDTLAKPPNGQSDELSSGQATLGELLALLTAVAVLVNIAARGKTTVVAGALGLALAGLLFAELWWGRGSRLVRLTWWTLLATYLGLAALAVAQLR